MYHYHFFTHIALTKYVRHVWSPCPLVHSLELEIKVKSEQRRQAERNSSQRKKRIGIDMSKQMMQAIRVHQYGGPEQLKLEQIPRPEPQAGEVLIRVYAAGVLPAEWKMRQGFFKGIQLPYIPGSAVAGVVEEIGPGVTTFQKGQAVFGRSIHGAYAEYTTTPVEPPALKPETFSLLALKPETLSFDEAATISGGATTAWAALFGDGALQAGQRVLIHGAAGGVGSFAVQFARLKGAHVIGTASTANLDFVRSLGAETVIDYTTTPFEQAVHNVDLVLDTIGGETLRRLCRWSNMEAGWFLCSNSHLKIWRRSVAFTPRKMPSHLPVSTCALLLN
jgi:NADPH:quinone reductase-like Zn-dependent oxidoreductase